MNLWNDALHDLDEVNVPEHLTTDQKLKVAEIKALLAIGQELSNIHTLGINPEYSQS